MLVYVTDKFAMMYCIKKAIQVKNLIFCAVLQVFSYLFVFAAHMGGFWPLTSLNTGRIFAETPYNRGGMKETKKLNI